MKAKRMAAVMFRHSFLLLFALFSASIVHPTTAQSGNTLEVLETEIERSLRDGNVPGASIVIIENQQVVFHQQFGVADRDTAAPISQNTIFRAGSISKSLTSIGIMMLVEDGTLTLDTPISDLLPELSIANKWEETDPVRLVHLLEHTAGLNDIAYGHYLISGAELSIADAVELYRPYKARWRPGTLHSYSNAGPVIAGLVIERVSGQSFQDFMQSRLMSPLKMHNSSWVRHPESNNRFSVSYRSDGVTPELFVEIPGRPSGSLNTTAEDLARITLLMLGRGKLDGVRYFQPETANRIERPQTSIAARTGLKFGYGLGNDVRFGTKSVYFGHDGSIDGFAATARYAPSLGSGYVIMINSTSSQLNEIAELIQRYLERATNAPEIARTVSPEIDSRMWTGQYQTLTPRRSFLSPILGLTQWQGVSFEEETLRFRGENWYHLGAGLFQKETATAPGIVFENGRKGPRLHTTTGTYRKVSPLEMWTKIVFLCAIPLVICMSILHALIWLPSAFLGRLNHRGGIWPRMVPAATLMIATLSAILPLFLFGSGDFAVLGNPTLLGWVAYALTILAPVSAVVSILVIFHGHSPLPARALSILQVGLALLISGYLIHGGWFALRIWHT